MDEVAERVQHPHRRVVLVNMVLGAVLVRCQPLGKAAQQQERVGIGVGVQLAEASEELAAQIMMGRCELLFVVV